MNSIKKHSNTEIGWNFDNSYSWLPEYFYTKTYLKQVAKPKLVIVNFALAKQLGLNFIESDETELANLFAGNQLPKGSEPIAQAYAGH